MWNNICGCGTNWKMDVWCVYSLSSALIGWNKADHLLIGLHPSYYTNSEFHPQIIFYLLNQISYPNIGYFVFNSPLTLDKRVLEMGFLRPNKVIRSHKYNYVSYEDSKTTPIFLIWCCFSRENSNWRQHIILCFISK